MGRVCEKTVQHRSRNEKRPSSRLSVTSGTHSCSAGSISDPPKTAFRNRNYLEEQLSRALGDGNDFATRAAYLGAAGAHIEGIGLAYELGISNPFVYGIFGIGAAVFIWAGLGQPDLISPLGNAIQNLPDPGQALQNVFDNEMRDRRYDPSSPGDQYDYIYEGFTGIPAW